MGRSRCCDKSKVKRGTWSPEEDQALKNYIAKHGTAGNWITLPHKAGLLRCGKSCRLRWLNYLRPDIRHGNFTQEERDIIWNLYNRIGSRWSVIASQLQGRTDNDVKNYWNTKIKKKLASPSTDPPAKSYTENPIVAASSTITENIGTATVASSATATATFQASTNLPSFSDPILLLVNENSSSFSNEPIDFNMPKFDVGGSSDFSSANSNFPVSSPHQELTSYMSLGFEMDENYGGNGIPIDDEGFGDYTYADLFSIFQC